MAGWRQSTSGYSVSAAQERRRQTASEQELQEARQKERAVVGMAVIGHKKFAKRLASQAGTAG